MDREDVLGRVPKRTRRGQATLYRTLSHRDCLMAHGGRTRLWARCCELFKTFDAVICAVMPTPAYPHDHSPEQEKRRIDGKE